MRCAAEFAFNLKISLRNNMWNFIIFVCALLVSFRGYNAQEELIDLLQGQVKGTKLKATSGRQFNAYLGIPYGKVTKRFAEADPAGPWEGVLDATKDAPACLQYPVQFHRPFEIFGQEDCLTLNVYTPEKSEAGQPWPVIVFFHGGGFVEGQAAMHLYGPQRMLNKNVIFVILNYRVGAFGFLSTGDDASPGNYGLLDQNLALKWVQQNIARFGGDPQKVTISGESAGGASVTYHLLSPLSAGLFHAAIHQSGSAICPWARQPSPLQIAQNIAKEPLVNCPTEDTHMMIECLRKVDPMAIVNVTAKIGPASVPFTSGPVVENNSNGKFLKEEPLKLLREGRFNKVPVMSAVAQDEATSLFVFLGFIDPTDNYKSSEAEVKGYVSVIAGLTDKDQPKIDKILKKYFDKADYSNSKDIRLRKFTMGSDAYFKSCTDMTIKLLSRHVPVYFYVFDHASQGTQVSNFTGHPDIGHGIILLYLYNMSVWGPNTYNEDDKIVSERVIDFWTTFARICKPTEDESVWPPASGSPQKYMDIQAKQTLKEDYQAADNKFWEEIFFPDHTSTAAGIVSNSLVLICAVFISTMLIWN